MQGEKKFSEVFSRYTPSAEKRELLDRGHSARFRYTKDPMRVEVDLSFDAHEDAELIYEIEDECRALYSAESFKILPHFTPECFDMRYFDEIACEAALCGAVTNGFFTGAKYEDDGEVITVSIPFCDAGVEFVKSSNTEAILSNILRSRYGVARRVSVVCGDGADTRSRYMARRTYHNNSSVFKNRYDTEAGRGKYVCQQLSGAVHTSGTDSGCKRQL